MTDSIIEGFSDRQKGKPYFDAVLKKIDQSEFQVPREYSDVYFPDFLGKILEEWVDYYEMNYMQLFQSVHWLPEQRQWRNMLESIKDEGIKLFHWYVI